MTSNPVLDKPVAKPEAKAPLRSAAMIASIADPGVRTTKAPFGYALNALAEQDQRIVGLTADLGKYTDMHIFAERFPERFFQMGMAEQMLMMAAAGMAEVGLIPFATTYSVFATRRAYDFICLDMAEPKLNVNLVSALPGLTTGYGPSHQATEDVAILRGMPNLTIFDPCDAVDIEQALPQLAACEGPTYTRLLRGAVPRILDEYDYTFELGKAKVVRPGTDVVFVSSGLMTMRALLAAEELKKHSIDVSVVHAPTLKPFDEETVVREIDTPRAAFTLENHTVIGGLFESVASAMIKRGVGKKVHAIGLPDEFIDAGALPTLHDRYGLSTSSIVARVLAELRTA
jgi:transketolase